MKSVIAKAHSETLRTWADQWERDESSGSREVAFLLTRAARLMIGEEDVPVEEKLSAPAVQSEFKPETD